jgi:branched-subunit amino acid transport protein
VSASWAVVVLAGLATIAIKALGPVAMGGRPLPARLDRVVSLLAPSLLAALVAINTFGNGESLTVDARVLGVAAGVAVWRRAPVLLVVVIAAAVTATARALGA